MRKLRCKLQWNNKGLGSSLTHICAPLNVPNTAKLKNTSTGFAVHSTGKPSPMCATCAFLMLTTCTDQNPPRRTPVRLFHESETVISVKARLISVHHWKTPETVIGLSNDVALCQSSHLALRMQDSCLKKALSYCHNCPLNGRADHEKAALQVAMERKGFRVKSHPRVCTVGCAKHRKTKKHIHGLCSSFNWKAFTHACDMCASNADHMHRSEPTT